MRKPPIEKSLATTNLDRSKFVVANDFSIGGFLIFTMQYNGHCMVCLHPAGRICAIQIVMGWD